MAESCDATCSALGRSCQAHRLNAVSSAAELELATTGAGERCSGGNTLNAAYPQMPLKVAGSSSCYTRSSSTASTCAAVPTTSTWRRICCCTDANENAARLCPVAHGDCSSGGGGWWLNADSGACANAAIAGVSWSDVTALAQTDFNSRFEATGGLLARFCAACASTHQVIVYQRTTMPSAPMSTDWYSLFRTHWESAQSGTSNTLHANFELYSSMVDLASGANKWTYCDYDVASVGFPGQCGPTGAVSAQWNALSGGQSVTWEMPESITNAPTSAPTTTASLYVYTPTTSCTYSTNGNAPCCGTATTIVIESSVAEIKAGAFQACTAVAVVDASQATSLVTIRAGAFYGMTSLLSVDLSAAAALTHIETDAFKLCAKLAQLKYPPGLLAVPGAGAFHSTAIEPTGVVWPSGGTPVCGGTEAYFDWAHACRGARTVVDALCSTSALDVASSACFPTMDAAAPQCVVEVDAAIVSAGALAWFTDPATLSLGMKLAANGALVTHVCVTH